MSVGDHLEELRRRLIYALLGFAVVLGVCLFFGDRVLTAFCQPLFETLQAKRLNPQLYYTELGESFVVWIRVSLISGAAIASPWIVYQLWLFVAAGLYPHERKYVTRYAPLSIALLVTGMLFVYFLVLPWTIQFFLDFAGSVPIPERRATTTQPYTPAFIPALPGDPANPRPNEIWLNTMLGQIRVNFEGRETRVINFAPQSLLAPHIAISDYIDLVVGMLLLFGLSFQLPLVVLALVKIGLLDLDTLRSMRRYVYMALAVLAAAITPGDVITATVALMIPLAGLYELGIWMAHLSMKESGMNSGQ
jgi:sec-independent protein translocase protein TatC